MATLSNQNMALQRRIRELEALLKAAQNRSPQGIPMALVHVDEKRREWRPYAVDFESPEGGFSTYLYAISFEHAHLQLDALKETGRLGGELHGVVAA